MLCAVLLFQRQQWEQLCRGCPAEVRLQYKRAYKASICAVYSLSTTLISTKFINEIGHAPCSVLFCLFENQDIIPSHVLGYCAAPNFELVKHILHCSPRLELLPHSYPKSTWTLKLRKSLVMCSPRRSSESCVFGVMLFTGLSTQKTQAYNTMWRQCVHCWEIHRRYLIQTPFNHNTRSVATCLRVE